jgi:hypothetical protein
MRDENDRSLIVIEEGRGNGMGSLLCQYKRKILVYGFCNYCRNGELSSACCIDCWGGLHGDNAIKKMELQTGDYVIASEHNNFISIVGNGSISKVKEFVFHKQMQKNEEWCVVSSNNAGISWYIKEENDASNDWTSDIEKANVFTRKEAEELAISLTSALGRGNYYAKRKPQ